MKDVERVIGALQEFKSTTERRLDSMEVKTDKRFDSLDVKVDSVIHLKWKILGGATVISSLLSLVVDFIRR